MLVTLSMSAFGGKADIEFELRDRRIRVWPGRHGRNEHSQWRLSSGAGPSTPFSVSHAIGHSHDNTGWVVGYGTEGLIDFWGSRNWTWKIEGLYVDLGHLDDNDAIVGPTLGPVTGGQTITHTHFTDGILRAGLNYKFY
jgi:opacity protein-like surface antigen